MFSAPNPTMMIDSRATMTVLDLGVQSDSPSLGARLALAYIPMGSRFTNSPTTTSKNECR